MISQKAKSSIVKDYRRHEKDGGSPEVQVAVLTARIAEVNEHLKNHKHDHAARRGLVLMVGKRNRLLRYLLRRDRDAYQNLIKRLGLRK
jgi:small subunit ribosomal protein S15